MPGMCWVIGNIVYYHWLKFQKFKNLSLLHVFICDSTKERDRRKPSKTIRDKFPNKEVGQHYVSFWLTNHSYIRTGRSNHETLKNHEHKVVFSPPKNPNIGEI